MSGWPWDTALAVKWSDRGRAADGTPYENEGGLEEPAAAPVAG